jgi:Tfp pilus assembly protein PilO
MNADELKTMAKKQPIGVACGLIAVACGVLLYFTSDTVDEKKDLAEQTAKTDKAILNNVANSKDLVQQTEAVQHNVKELESRLIHASQLAINLQYFYRLESETNVKMTEVHQGGAGQPRPGSGKANYTSIPFTVNIQGDFKQVLDFIQRVENGPRIARFNSVSFAKLAGEGIAPDQFTVGLGIEFLGTP